MPLVLLENNVHLREQYPDSITDELAQRYCNKLSEKTKSFGFEVKYFTTSPETGSNIHKCFEYLGKSYFDFVAQSQK